MLPVEEIDAFIDAHRKQGVKVHVDLLISDSIQRPPSEKDGEVDVTESLLGVCCSIAWLNLERDLKHLVWTHLSDTDAEARVVLHDLRRGAKRNFARPFGTLRVVSPINLEPRGRQERTQFSVPTSKQDADELAMRGAVAAWRACRKS